jgi:hypothetical protein
VGSSTMIMKEAGSSEMFAPIYQHTWCHIPEEYNHNRNTVSKCDTDTEEPCFLDDDSRMINMKPDMNFLKIIHHHKITICKEVGLIINLNTSVLFLLLFNDIFH